MDVVAWGLVLEDMVWALWGLGMGFDRESKEMDGLLSDLM